MAQRILQTIIFSSLRHRVFAPLRFKNLSLRGSGTFSANSRIFGLAVSSGLIESFLGISVTAF